MRMQLIVTFATHGEGGRSEGLELSGESMDQAVRTRKRSLRGNGQCCVKRIWGRDQFRSPEILCALRFPNLTRCKPVSGEEAPRVRQLGARGLRTAAG
jgi:hypothetical protein